MEGEREYHSSSSLFKMGHVEVLVRDLWKEKRKKCEKKGAGIEGVDEE